MKNILLCTDGSIFGQSSYQYAAWLANRIQSVVNVMYVTDLRSQTASRNFSGSIGLGASDALMDELVELEHKKAKLNRQRAKQILDEAHQVLTSNGVESVKTIHRDGFLVDCFQELEADANLVILGKRGENAEFASGHLGANVERIMRSSKKPILVTSRQFKPIAKILIAYDDGASCRKILDFLTNSALFQGLELHIIAVSKNVTDEKAIARLSGAQKWSQSTGIAAQCSVVAGKSETAIGEYATQNNIDLLLMGAYGHSRIRHLVIGSTTAQILRSSNIPVLVFR
ncbi:universal stress protein [Pseudanabaena galeata UHCC 0370]|uniref:Universal stress protein n=1 Tax=Pseudanabaena galeata UHCC 0370 TaxID=3110310 RepID=A0ABU5TL30_9CYAN|nr:universal stress protein [Pseudanabaena galeata]MEA5478967.1 universal stress protein [Pseudanabaena galeata UHCC 0370]